MVTSITAVFAEPDTLTVWRRTFLKFQPANEEISLGTQPITISQAILIL